MALAVLSPSRLRKSNEQRPLPSRRILSLEKLRRVVPPVEIHSVDDLIEQYGFSGVEVGNYVSNAESVAMQNWLAQSTHDLRQIVGPCLVRLHRRGNLAIAFDSRGSGAYCAHYETTTRVINLTKSKGDGSFAHEWGHFIDHFLESQMRSSSRLFLSDQVVRDKQIEQSPCTEQMKKIMKLIKHDDSLVQISGDLNPKRWYDKFWIENALRRSKGDPQLAFDSLSKQYPRQFVHGPKAEKNSSVLVDSISKWTASSVTINAAYLRESSYLKSAKMLTAYWFRPCELFARAFESYVEDALHADVALNEFLVNQTRANYDQSRANPYPQGLQRVAINNAIAELLQLVNGEQL